MTGRGAGFCADFGSPGYRNQAPAFGFGMGFRRGCRFWGGFRGWRNWNYADRPWNMRPRNFAFRYQEPDYEMEKEELKHQINALRSELDSIKKRLDTKESGSAAD
jgi:hypothetical protein